MMNQQSLRLTCSAVDFHGFEALQRVCFDYTDLHASYASEKHGDLVGVL